MPKRAQPIDRDATTAAERLFDPEEEKDSDASDSPLPPHRPFDENRLKASERWEIGPCIGHGGMARVYKAFDHRLRRTVALKILVHEEPDLLRRFQREARAQAKVQHEHILEVYDVGEIDTQPYIAMRYVEGSTLRELFDQLTVEEKVGIFLQVAEALHAAHRVGLLHRDVKPSNILVERRDGGELKAWVADFGIVSEIDDPSISSSLTGTGGFIGTPVYIPPERLMTPKERVSKDVLSDPRGDVYSLGITMYQTLTGVAPFTDEDLFELLDKIVKDDPLPPSIYNPEIPSGLEKVVMKCLAKYPEQRYSSARELAWKLRTCLPRREGPWRPPVGWWKVPAAVLALLLAGFVAGAGWRAMTPDGSRWEKLRQAEDQAWAKDVRDAETELHALARIHYHSALLLKAQGNLPAAERELRASLAALTRLGNAATEWPQEAVSHCELGTVLRDQGQTEAARTEYGRALGLLQRISEDSGVETDVTGLEKALAGLDDGTGEADPCALLTGF